MIINIYVTYSTLHTSIKDLDLHGYVKFSSNGLCKMWTRPNFYDGRVDKTVQQTFTRIVQPVAPVVVIKECSLLADRIHQSLGLLKSTLSLLGICNSAFERCDWLLEHLLWTHLRVVNKVALN